MKKLNQSILAATLAAASASAMADKVNFSGFGTIGFSQAGSGEVVHGVDEDGSWSKDTVIGLQADTRLTENLSATAQIRLTEDTINSEQMQMTLQTGFLGYQASDELMIRTGRLRAPFYLNSEFMDVGAVTNTASNPIGVYYQAPFQNYNGIDAIYTTEIGENELQFQPYAGMEQFEYKLPDGSGKKFDANYIIGMNVALTAEDWKVRAGYTIGEMNDPAYTPNPATDAMMVNNDSGSFLTVGGQYDNGSLVATAEYAQRSVDGAISLADLTGYYASVGYRMGNALPYITVQSLKSADKNHNPALSNAAFHDMTGAGVGLKYELGKYALKAEYTDYKFGSLNGSYASPLNGMNANTKSASNLKVSLSTTF